MFIFLELSDCLMNVKIQTDDILTKKCMETYQVLHFLICIKISTHHKAAATDAPCYQGSGDSIPQSKNLFENSVWHQRTFTSDSRKHL